jgi:hypothetical protein
MRAACVEKLSNRASGLAEWLQNGSGVVKMSPVLASTSVHLLSLLDAFADASREMHCLTSDLECDH